MEYTILKIFQSIPQYASDESAEILLKRIKAEKAKVVLAKRTKSRYHEKVKNVATVFLYIPQLR